MIKQKILNGINIYMFVSWAKLVRPRLDISHIYIARQFPLPILERREVLVVFYYFVVFVAIARQLEYSQI